MIIWLHGELSGVQCRRCPTEAGSRQALNEEIANNRLQIRNLRTLKYREPCWRILFDEFFIMRIATEGVPGTYSMYPPWFCPLGQLKPEARGECFAPLPMASLQSRDGCEALSRVRIISDDCYMLLEWSLIERNLDSAHVLPNLTRNITKWRYILKNASP